MSTKKRFYINPAADYQVELIDREHPTYSDYIIAEKPSNLECEPPGYLTELCDLLNKAHEATDNLNDVSDGDLLSELRRRISKARKEDLDDWIDATYDLHDDACLTEPQPEPREITE